MRTQPVLACGRALRTLLVILFVAAGLGGVFLATAPAALAQDAGAVPGNALGNSSDSNFWRAIRQGESGNVSLPNQQAGVLIQSNGEDWRIWRNGPLKFWGGIALVGMLALLALFFALRGRIRVDHGLSGRTVRRFNGFERFAHWLTALSFVVLGLTGLNLMFGRELIIPLLGKEAFATITQAGKYLHNYVAFAFMIGLVLILVLWIRQNIPNRYDLIWLVKAGGMLGGRKHPPARKFNAGQKILYWLVIIGGISISLTGLGLMFPFEISYFEGTFRLLNLLGLDLPTSLSATAEMQLTQLWHAIVGIGLIVVIFGHIYIGTLGMQGAFDAMGSGDVDENWAREHHSVWMDEIGRQPGAGDD
ncbi:formate dehydrogenase subunit gamma [Oceanibacterium hippocampi]|uniref:Formate dehydrogenase, nitrate-inducible, cytochrome b556(Fdn) subunit n=1 Tax=Oceanibacterium hippocampi TaxID=745714 RepID=A0A1Y5TC68_9PROT|nr:formate dehydrogenase subunit gamma [Oceanibacterium hippocampi]SLN60429.1 Formate dehydrogenase, nitrate-inducible, cytochrome b556(Fdn) subunit [Oceanibacterium hippocampi]